MRKILISALILFLNWATYAQDFSATLAKKFNLYREKYVQEKLFVSTDRQFYLTGEFVWFNVISVDASFHKPLDISKVAYVEILNRNNEPVAQAKIELNSGRGSGSFFLPTSLSSDNYVLRAYTHWMKNFDPEFYFHKVIGIVNPFVQIESRAQQSVVNRVDFFPEGGNLVNSMKTRVAYRLTSSSSEPGVLAFLLDEKNDTLFTSRKDVGSFEIVPDVQKRYKAGIKSHSGVSFQDFLPVKSSGYGLRLMDKNDLIEISAKRISDKELPDDDLVLFAHSRNRIVKNESKRAVNGTVAFMISKNELPEGITHFTLFTNKGEIVSQRLYFKKREESPLNVIVEKTHTGTRLKNTFQISASTQEVLHATSSVTKVDSISTNDLTSLRDYLLLNSDVGSDITRNWKNASSEEIDNYMLTQTWKRFSWTKILSSVGDNKFLPESRSHVIRATVTDVNGTPKKDVIVYLASPDKVIQTYNSKSDEQGQVSFEMTDFYGNHKLYLQTNRLIDSTSVIKIENPFSNQFASFSLPDLPLNNADEKRLLARSVRMQAQNIFFEESESQFQEPKIDSLPFYGKAEEIYRLDDYTRFPLMEEVMREYVPGVVVRKRKDGFNFYVLNKIHNYLFKETPLILLDGVPVFDADEIMQMDPLKVKRLDVVTAKYFHGNLELPGIVSYHTYGGDLGGFTVRSRNGIVDYDGLQIQRKFFSPSYSSSDSESRIPDPRYLLYWNPDVKMDGNQKTEIEFFTSDVPGTYQIKVEGVSNDGKIVQGSATFVVADH
jgi:hypothetical protein